MRMKKELRDMSELTCIIIGGGHAGIGALKSIKEATKGNTNGNRIRFVLIDKYPGHVPKVKLFRPAVDDGEIMVPWTQLFPNEVEFVQGKVTSVNKDEKQIQYTDAQGKNVQIRYDLLVVTVGSIVRQPDSHLGGIALTEPQTAVEIKERWRQNLQKAVDEKDPEERKRLMTIVVAGAGISGMETSAELVYAMRREAESLGLNPHDASVYLLNAKERLFQEGPEKVGVRLERLLNEYGVTVLHNCKAIGEEAGVIKLNNGDYLSAGLLVWTIGLVPNPALRTMGLPLTSEGQVQVDECYRVHGTPGVYSIGDCAGIIDPKTGKTLGEHYYFDVD